MRIVKFIILIAFVFLLLLVFGVGVYFVTCACVEIKPNGTAETNVNTITVR